jgi:putative ABC transport system permease protein
VIGDVLLLAGHYLRHQKGRSLILLVCLTATASLPLTVHRLFELFQRGLLGRAEATPLVMGASGSRFDLVLHALTFTPAAPGLLTQAERFAIEESGQATAIPLLARHTARGHRIVGTTGGYFPFRGLAVAAGKMPAMLGDCVLGADVAERLRLRPGDRLVSDTENLFDLAGARPLDLHVAGVLKRAHSPDDRVVFVELETAWILAGIGHGHERPEAAHGGAVDPGTPAESTPAGPAPLLHTRITVENLPAFHFHGDPAGYPLTAILAIPPDARARSLLLGRYVTEGARTQAIRPEVVVAELLGLLIPLKRFLDVHHAFLLGVTALLVVLVMLLTLRLRRREMATLVHLGCSRRRAIAVQGADLLILLVTSLVLAAGISTLAAAVGGKWIRALGG